MSKLRLRCVRASAVNCGEHVVFLFHRVPVMGRVTKKHYVGGQLRSEVGMWSVPGNHIVGKVIN